ncbi:hypothetical protein CEXT_28861 [Caerostris extrusa]|uniref:Uncharacterized protein n=1 Tax=Caerostris extrusa TaxID=172846 RepID=A0AAV4Y9N3_CAEEX|nr:hypothetical protein CEXT_28861 [Caerostris extrusa]
MVKTSQTGRGKYPLGAFIAPSICNGNNPRAFICRIGGRETISLCAEGGGKDQKCDPLYLLCNVICEWVLYVRGRSAFDLWGLKKFGSLCGLCHF